MRALLTRTATSPLGTLGKLALDDFECVTMEPPWQNNEPNVSCIPPGEYQCHWHKSPRYMWVYALLGIEGRSHILIHPGNIVSHTRGCILPGQRVGVLGGLPAVLASRHATRRLFAFLDKRPFTLEVEYA